jgi:hypothetical protein
MRRYAALAVAATLVLMVAAPVLAAPGPPANDNFANATVISSLSYTKHQNTTSATVEGSEPTGGCQGMGQTVWYAFTPGTDMFLDANTLGSKAQDGDYDTVIKVWTYNGSFSLVDCDDDGGGGPNGHWSDVLFSATSGTTYYFQVGDCCSLTDFEVKHAGLVFNLSEATP